MSREPASAPASEECKKRRVGGGERTPACGAMIHVPALLVSQYPLYRSRLVYDATCRYRLGCRVLRLHRFLPRNDCTDQACASERAASGAAQSTRRSRGIAWTAPSRVIKQCRCYLCSYLSSLLCCHLLSVSLTVSRRSCVSRSLYSPPTRTSSSTRHAASRAPPSSARARRSGPW
jgi:hypothetical protein